MTKLQQLESNLVQHENSKKILTNQIAEEKLINKNKQVEPYLWLIGQCLKSKHCDVHMYKILEIVEIVDINKDTKLIAKVLRIEPNRIQILDKIVDDLYYESITEDKFDTFATKTLTNLMQYGKLNVNL